MRGKEGVVGYYDGKIGYFSSSEADPRNDSNTVLTKLEIWAMDSKVLENRIVSNLVFFVRVDPNDTDFVTVFKSRLKDVVLFKQLSSPMKQRLHIDLDLNTNYFNNYATEFVNRYYQFLRGRYSDDDTRKLRSISSMYCPSIYPNDLTELFAGVSTTIVTKSGLYKMDSKDY